MEVYKSWKVINRGDEASLKEIEESVKNKFNWGWLEKSIITKVNLNGNESDITTYAVDCIRKIDKPGKALCMWCECEINYGGGGWPRIKDHLGSKKHKEVYIHTKLSNILCSYFI